MIVPHKLLNDSRLAAFIVAVSNKSAPKAYEKAPILVGAGQNKFTVSFPNDSAKVDIIFGKTKNAASLHSETALHTKN